jgi:hypothetical protein
VKRITASETDATLSIGTLKIAITLVVAEPARTHNERGRDDLSSAFVYLYTHNALEKSLEANRRIAP